LCVSGRFQFGIINEVIVLTIFVGPVQPVGNLFPPRGRKMFQFLLQFYQTFFGQKMRFVGYHEYPHI
jgi:hypothetical protein